MSPYIFTVNIRFLISYFGNPEGSEKYSCVCVCVCVCGGGGGGGGGAWHGMVDIHLAHGLYVGRFHGQQGFRRQLVYNLQLWHIDEGFFTFLYVW